MTAASYLPDVLLPLSREFGLERALDVADKVGGQRIYLPKELDDSHDLARKLGIDVAQYLARKYGPGKLLVPMGPTGSFQAARRMIDALLVEGKKSTPEIAKLARCHVRTVEKHKQRLTQSANDRPQLKLL